MDFLILYKWTVDWTNRTDQAPSIISLMIGMALKPGTRIEYPLWDGESQLNLQDHILFLALWTIPWMLICKPVILLIKNFFKESKTVKRASNAGHDIIEDNVEKELSENLKDIREDIELDEAPKLK